MSKQAESRRLEPGLSAYEMANPYTAPGWTRRGFELRYGWGGGWNTRAAPYTAPHEPNYVPLAPFNDALARQRQLDALRRRAALLEAELDRIRRRLRELELGEAR